MVEKIIFTVVAFVLFIYIFWFKLIKKNDTTYITILILQAFGILINFIQILFNIFSGSFFYCLIYLFNIIIPILVFLLEFKEINISEKISILRTYFYKSIHNRKKAKQIIIELTKKYEDSYLAHKILAEIYEEEGGMRKAIDEYVKTLDLNQKDSKSYFKISELLYELDKKDEAIQMLKNLLKSRQDNKEAMQLLGKILMEQEDFKNAIDIYSKLAVKYPKDEMAFYNLGIAYARTNEFSLAKKCYLKVIELNNENYNAYYRLAQISLLYRDYDMSEHYFKKSLCQTNESKVYFELAKIYVMKNDKQKANFVLIKAIEADSRIYQKMIEEPILFSLRNNIKKPTEEHFKEFEQSLIEKTTEEYLNDTYVLTKILNDKNKK